MPDLCGSAGIELPRADARQLGLEERGRIGFRLFSPTRNGAISCVPPPGTEDEAEEAIDRSGLSAAA